MNTKSPLAATANPMVGWTVVGYGFLAIALSASARALLSLVMPLWESEMGWTRSLISTAGAVALIVMAITAPIAGDFIDRLGPRKLLAAGFALLAAGLALTTVSTAPWQLMLNFGVISGVGFGVVGASVFFAAVAPYFVERRGFAMAVVDSGSTVGPLLLVPLAAFVLTAWGWRNEFLAAAAASALMVPIALYLLPRNSGKHTAHQDASQEPMRARLLALARSPTFNLLFWSFLLCGFTSSGVIETHFLPYAAICGFGGVKAAGAYGLLSGINLVGVLVAGWLSDRMNRPLLLAGIYVVRSLSFILLMQVGNDVTLLYAFSVIFGLFDYATAPVVASLVASHLGVRVMGLSMGLLSAGHSLGAALGAYAGGVAFDVLGSYRWLWIISVSMALLAALIAAFIRKNPTQGHQSLQASV
jgi:predicted MFS family arabinose efflux permease